MNHQQNPQLPAADNKNLLFSRLIENSKDLIYRYEFLPTRGFTYVNPAAVAITGYTPEEYYANPALGLSLVQAEISKDHARVLQWTRKDGSVIWTEQQNVPVYNEMGDLVAIEGVARDVTAREQILQALRLENQRFLRFFDANIVGIGITDASGKFFMANDYYLSILGATRQDFLDEKLNWRDATPPEWLPADDAALNELSEQGICRPYEKEYIRPDGTRVPVYLVKAMLPGAEQQIATFVLDIAERRLAEKALQKSHRQLQQAEQIGKLGHWEWLIEEDRMSWSEGLYRLFGLHSTAFHPKYRTYLEQIHPEDQAYVQQAVEAALQQRTLFEFENRILCADGSIRHLYTRGEVLLEESGQPERMIGVVVDTTERVQAERAVQKITEDLRRSNAELEQFAYVASHDLQEPLRMVTSYVHLLAQRYQGKLDTDADEFIGYAVDGAKRMQNLINDLLAYARVGTRGNPFTSVSVEELLLDSLRNLEIMIQESGAEISHDPLPVVKADSVQLSTVLQNLVSNAIKYRGMHPPRIHVAARREPREWVFSVRDNGIGIDPKFSERIFVIFQRLNAPGSFPGTGIGLAICKRIIQRHGGRIWVESTPGLGATFYFTIPVEITS